MNTQTIDTLGLGGQPGSFARPTVARVKRSYAVSAAGGTFAASNADRFAVPATSAAPARASLFEILAAAAGSIVDAARRTQSAWLRAREARATYDALSELDARTLRDIGLDRSELLSVAAEFAGEAERTRARALSTLRMHSI